MSELHGVASNLGSTNSDLAWDFESGALLESDASEPLIRGNARRMLNHRSLWAKLKERAWLLPVIYTQFWSAAVVSLVAPFFPPLADSRGILAWEYGFFFSTMKLMMLPGAVIAEKMISNVSARAGYLGGQVTTVLFSVTCGFLYWVKGGNLLLGLSLAVAALGGCSSTVYSVCLYTLLTSRFQDDGGMFIVGVRALRADLLTSVHQSVHQKLLVYLVPPTVPTLCH